MIITAAAPILAMRPVRETLVIPIRTIQTRLIPIRPITPISRAIRAQRMKRPQAMKMVLAPRFLRQAMKTTRCSL